MLTLKFMQKSTVVLFLWWFDFAHRKLHHWCKHGLLSSFESIGHCWGLHIFLYCVLITYGFVKSIKWSILYRWLETWQISPFVCHLILFAHIVTNICFVRDNLINFQHLIHLVGKILMKIFLIVFWYDFWRIYIVSLNRNSLEIWLGVRFRVIVVPGVDILRSIDVISNCFEFQLSIFLEDLSLVELVGVSD